MPFQDVEDEPIEVPKPPGTVERVLRKIFVEDFGLKLLALAITLLVWMAVTGENQPITIHTAVQLNFVRPDNLGISNDPPRTVEVLLTGSRNRLNNLRLLDLVATVDLTDSKPGDRVIRLSPERVAIQLPAGVKISSFQPATLPIRLEPIVRREVMVEVHLDGEPAAGFEVYSTQSTPGAVWIAGPASHVNELQKAPTETISVDGRKETFTVPRVSIAIADEKLDVADNLVDIVVTIGEKRIQKRFENVPLLRSNSSQSQTAAVTLIGPTGLLQQLKAEDITLVLDAGETVPKLQLPPAMQDHIKLISIDPHSPKN
jgi:YbbR domain-containing protein